MRRSATSAKYFERGEGVLAVHFILDTCIKLELIDQGEERSIVGLRLYFVQDPGVPTAAIIGVKTTLVA